MREEDLDKTKPISILNDDTLVHKNESSVLRSEKYKDAVEQEMRKELAEEAEEALAEKNIAIAEDLLEQERLEAESNLNSNEYLKSENFTIKSEKEDEKKEHLHFITKLKRKWNNLDKKQKIICLAIAGIIFLIILTLIIILLVNSKEEEQPNKPNNKVEEVAPVVVDNFYYKDGSLHLLDNNEKEIGTYECDNKDDKLCYVGLNNYRDSFDVVLLLDQNKEEKLQRLPIYENNYVFIFDSKNEKTTNIKLYSLKEEKVLEEYMDIKAYDNNYIIVKNKSNEYGLIEIKEEVKEVIKPQYRYLGMIDGENNLIAQNSRGYVVIDKTNKVLSSIFNSTYEIKNYNSNFVVAKVANEYNVYDYKANLLESGYDYATIKDNYMALVKENKLYVKDAKKLKYNENGINLKNKDYVLTYVYDKDGKLSSTKRSFSLDINDSRVEVSLYDEEKDTIYKQLDVVVAKANEKYDYVSYFEDRLYFYSDKDKENVLGYYTCSNQNIVNTEKDEYTSCFVASDTIYEDNDMASQTDLNRKSRIPLINNKFVFIADGSNNVVLFDLTEQKSLSSYTSVNTYTKNNDNTFTLYNGSLDIVALNKKGKYGMLSIDGTEVKTKYKFDYNRMEKLGSYYLTSSTNGKWKIIYDENNESAEYSGKIRGYNSDVSYFKIIVNNKYAVYDSNALAINNETYEYVELYTDYYAAVNNKEVNIYSYDGEKISTEGIKIGNYPYNQTDKPAFTVRKSNNKYIVSVYNGSTYDDFTVKTSTDEEEQKPNQDDKKEEEQPEDQETNQEIEQ